MIAEGVENDEQLDFLRKKCHFPGFLCSPPLPAVNLKSFQVRIPVKNGFKQQTKGHRGVLVMIIPRINK